MCNCLFNLLFPCCNKPNRFHCENVQSPYRIQNIPACNPHPHCCCNTNNGNEYAMQYLSTYGENYQINPAPVNVSLVTQVNEPQYSRPINPCCNPCCRNSARSNLYYLNGLN